MTTEPVFQLAAAAYRYPDGSPGIEPLTFDIHAGECVAVLGANGSGKSTLLKLLDGLYFPSGGALWAFGVPLTEAAFRDSAFNRSFRRRVGFVFQDPDVQLFLPTVYDEVAFGPLQLGMAREEVARRVSDALEMLGIGHLSDRAPHHLSAGEKKKVTLATLLALSPDVWLLDEPTAALDPRAQSRMIDFLLELAQSGKTLVIATHDLEIAHVAASRCIVLGEDHRLMRDGPPQEILGDRELLLRANLIHAHRHLHDGRMHSHEHRHW